MAIFQLLPQTEVLRVEVSARTEQEDSARRSRISQARLVVYSAGPRSQPRFSLTIKGPVWHRTGQPPCSWHFVTGDLANRIGPVLRIFLAPGAYIEDLNRAFQRAQVAFSDPNRPTGPYRFVPLGLEVIRVSDPNLLPELGHPAPAPFHGFSPSPWSYVASDFWEEEEREEARLTWLRTTAEVSEHEPTVSVLPDGLLITKAAHRDMPRWQVRIKAPRDEPAAFAYNLFGPSLSEHVARQLPSEDRAHLERLRGHYTLRVVKTQNVSIELAVEQSSRVQAVDLGIEYHVVSSSSRPQYREEGGRRFREAELVLPLSTPPLATEHWNHIALVPVQGRYLDPQRYQFYTLSHQNRANIPSQFSRWSSETLTQYQVVGDPIHVRGQRPGARLGRVAPRITSSFTPDIQFAIAAFEIVVGLIPIVGTLYDIASLMHLSATGRSLWGERRDITYWDLLGIGGMGLGLVGDAASARRAFGRAAEFYDRAHSTRHGVRHVVNHLAPPMQRSVHPLRPDPVPLAQRTRPPRRRAVDMSDFTPSTFSTRGIELMQRAASQARQHQARQVRDLSQAIQELGTDIDEVIGEVLIDAPNELVNRLRSSSSPQQLARRLIEASGGDAPDYAARLIEHHERARLLTVFTPDFSAFSNPLLAQGFLKHNARRIRQGQRPRTAASWALVTRGQYLAELRVVLGVGFRRRIRRAQALGTLSDLDADAMRAFHELRRRIQPYTELADARRARSTSTADLGAFFDADHLLEKRFINQIRTRLPNFDTGSLQALLVPKNQAVLRRMRGLDSGLNIYDHATKTQLMRALIPYREHHLFSLQQWWDAHVWVYRQLVTDNLDDVLDALESDFNRLARQLGESLNPHRALPDGLDLLPSNQMGRASSMEATP